MSEKQKVNAIEKLTDEQGNSLVPYFVLDREIHRHEKANKRMFILVIVLLVALFITNAGWIYYENQFEDICIEQEGETDLGGNNYFNGTGEMNLYGQSEANSENPPSEDGR